MYYTDPQYIKAYIKSLEGKSSFNGLYGVLNPYFFMIEIGEGIIINPENTTKQIYDNLRLHSLAIRLEGGFKDSHFIPVMIIDNFDTYLYFNKAGDKGKVNRIIKLVRGGELNPNSWRVLYKRHFWNI